MALHMCLMLRCAWGFSSHSINMQCPDSASCFSACFWKCGLWGINEVRGPPTLLQWCCKVESSEVQGGCEHMPMTCLCNLQAAVAGLQGSLEDKLVQDMAITQCSSCICASWPSCTVPACHQPQLEGKPQQIDRALAQPSRLSVCLSTLLSCCHSSQQSICACAWVHAFPLHACMCACNKRGGWAGMLLHVKA